MSIFRIYPKKSNTVASGVFENFNSGQNAAAELWYGGSEIFSNRNSISRHLALYDIEELQRKIDSKEILSGNVTSYKLYMRNAIPRDAALETDFTFNTLTKEIASSFDLITFPVNKFWDEGTGYDILKQNYVVKQIGNPRITGYSNWNFATRTTAWDEPGVYISPTASTTNCIYSGAVDYSGVTFSKLDSTISGETFAYSINSSTGLTGGNFSVIVTATTGNANLIDYTYNPLSGASSPAFFSGITTYSGMTFLQDSGTSVSTVYDFDIIAQDSLLVSGEVTMTGSSIEYTYNPLSGGTTSASAYTGTVIYSGLTFLKSNATASTVYDFEVISSTGLSVDQQVSVTGNSVDYNFNPLSGSVLSVSAYTGSVIYSGLTFTKDNDTAPNIYDFNITSSSALTSSFITTVTGNSTIFNFNPLSGTPTTQDFQISLTGSTGFTALDIDVVGGSTGSTVTSGDAFNLSATTFIPGVIGSFLPSTLDMQTTLLANTGFTELDVSLSGGMSGTSITAGDAFNLSAITFLPSIFTPFVPSTLDFENALSASTGFTATGIQVSGGTSGTTATSGDTFFLSATTLIPRTVFPFVPTTFDLVTGLTATSTYNALELVNTPGDTGTTITAGDSFTITANSLCIEVRLWSEQHFDIGDEDIDMDVSAMVNNWLEGAPNYGLGIAFREDYEERSGDTRSVTSYLTEKTNTAFKPYIEVRYDQVIRDDRDQVTNNRNSRLFLYTFSGNNPVDFYSAGTVEIVAPNNTVIFSGNPIQFQKGVYYIDVLMNSANPGETYRDIWRDVTFVPGIDKQDFTQFFRINKNYYQNATPSINDYIITTYGIDNGSTLRQEENIRVFADIRTNYSQGVPSPYFEIKYSLVMNNQEEVIPWTSMNRAVRNGCQETYFDLDASWLLHNQTYEVLFKIEELGSSKLLNESIRFNVLRQFS